MGARFPSRPGRPWAGGATPAHGIWFDLAQRREGKPARAVRPAKGWSDGDQPDQAGGAVHSGYRLRPAPAPEEPLRLDLTVFGVGVIIGTGIFVLTGQQAAVNAGPAIVHLVPHRRRRLRAGRAVLRRVRLHRPGRRLRVHLLLRHPRRVRRLDHRLGPAARAGPRRRRGVARLVGVPAVAARPADLAGRRHGASPDWGAVFIVAALTARRRPGHQALRPVHRACWWPSRWPWCSPSSWSARSSSTPTTTPPFIPPAAAGGGTPTGGDAPLLQVLAGVTPQHFGWFGILAAASIVFFAYIGFDIVATTAEETRNPQRDMPRGILGLAGRSASCSTWPPPP